MRLLLAAALLAAALLALPATASLARADPLDDLARQATGAVQDGAGQAGALAGGAVGDATSAAQRAAQQGAEAASGAVGTADGAAQQGLAQAGRVAGDALAQGSQVPGLVLGPYGHVTGVALREVRIGADYAARRVGGVPALDEPWLLGLGAYDPYLGQLGGAVVVRFGLQDLQPTLEVPDPTAHLPDPVAVYATTLAYATGNAAATQAWVAGAEADTLATAQAMLDAARG